MKSLKIFCIVLVGLIMSSVVYAEKLYTAKTSGIMIKDTIEVHVFDDPDIGGVACYYTLPKRAMSFTDQTDSSLSCRQIGPITGHLTTKKSIVNKSKSPLFKTMVMDRVYDAKRNVLIYLTYTKKMDGDNASNSISVVPIMDANYPKKK